MKIKYLLHSVVYQLCLVKVLSVRNLNIILTVAFLICSNSCKKFVEIDSPPDLIQTKAVFSNDETATSAVVGLYNQMTASNLNLTNGGMTIFPGLSADEIYNTSSNGTYDPFTNNVLSSDNGTIDDNFWSSAYRNIYQCNAILEGLINSNELTDSIKRQLTGEAEFARAFYYFYLVNLFGDVPLITNTNYQINASMPRTPIDTVYKKIISDLQNAQTLLTSSYPTTQRARPNKWAVTALLARIYLYRADWANAEMESSKVINSGLYSLTDNLNQVFLSNGQGTIWQLSRESDNTAEARMFIPSTSTVKPTFALTDYLINAFETGDNRRKEWIDSSIIEGQTYYYPYKYKVRQNNSVTEYLIVFRLAEQYLIRAEARSHENDLAGAVEDLNMIRSRAGLPSLSSGLSQVDMLSAVTRERRVELFCEWGHRWVDLKRSGEIDSVLAIEKSEWKHTAALYPIPFHELQVNKSLIQNPGYNY